MPRFITLQKRFQVEVKDFSDVDVRHFAACV